MHKVYELAELWDNSVKGEEQSFALLHKSLYPYLFNYAVKKIKDEDVVDDLLVDLFVRFWRNKLQIGSIGDVKSHFYRSARSMTLNYIKRQQAGASKFETTTEFEMSK